MLKICMKVRRKYNMGEQTFIDTINKSIQESERQMMQMGRPLSRATREQALKQVAMLEVARSSFIQEEIKTDKCGRILLTEEMKTSLHNAERSLEDGRCLNKEQFHERFAKWL